MYSLNERCQHGLSISWLINFFACLHIQAEQAMIFLMPTKIQVIMSNNVNSILLRLALGIVLAIDSVLLKMEQLMSCPLEEVTISVKQLRNVQQTPSP